MVSRYVRYKLTLKKSAGGCDGRAKSVAERSYPTSEVRGRSREDPMPKGRRPRGVTARPRSGQRPRVLDCDGAVTAERSCPTSEVRGGGREEIPSVRGQGQRREDLPRVRGQGQWLGGATPHPWPGAVAGRTNPTSKEPWLRWRRRA